MPVLFFRSRLNSGVAVSTGDVTSSGSGSSGASTSGSGSSRYPSMLTGNRLVFDSDQVDFANLKNVIISDNDKASGPNARIGEISLSFSGPVVLENWEDLRLNHSSVNVAGQDVECKEIISNELRAKVKNLVNHIPKIASHKPRFLQNVQKASTGESDSDDEDVPLDQEILPTFDEQSVVMIQMHSNIMCREWQRVVNASYSNGPGKFRRLICKISFDCFP